ncbi:cysteine hydrolase [Enterocloster aldenensis]|uniref:cysteine hydrolase family protein n=1 Tax=Enterocloster aldenensis TaxID=358742 RepID=UPI000E4DFFDA|nr:cysteine hydrolase [Enterocloster aldenensis]
MKEKILVVVDMQYDFVYGSLGTPEAQAIVPKVIEKVTNFDGTVVFTRDTHEEDYLETFEGKKLPVVHCVEGTSGWEIITEILNAGSFKRPQKDLSWIYDKTTFGCINLAKDIQNKLFIEQDELEIELIGLCTDICVVTNALLLRAYMPEVPIRVDSSCCAGVTKETHEAALKTMQMCQIDIV